MASDNRPSRSSQRLHDLDALRAVAMLLGILLHGTLFVLPEPILLWPIHDPAATGDPFYQVMIEFIHGFRMPVFFLLSGFFSVLLWERRGLREFAMQRLKRVGIPFIVGCLTVVPLGVWLVLHFGEGWKEPYWVLPLVWLFGTLGHLWFLWYLLLMAAGLVIAARLGVRFGHPIIWWLTIPLSLASALLMIEPVVGGDGDAGTGLVPNPALLWYYTCFFVFGAFMYRRDIVVRRWWSVALIPATGAFTLVVYLLYLHNGHIGGTPENAYMFRNWLTLVATVFDTAFAWLMCIGLMGLFRWIAARERFWVRYMSDASYWMYLMHMFLVILGQRLVVGWPIHYHLKFLLVCGGVTVILVVSYQLLVRYTFIGRALNGPRTRRGSEPPSQPAPVAGGDN